MKLHCFILLGCIALATSCQTQRPSRAGSLLLRPGAEAGNTPAPDRFLVRLETTRGDLIVDVHREWSPHGVDRFYHLVRAGYYDQAAFFRVIAGKWAQFGINGDPQIARLWREQRIPDDPRILSNTRGTLAFAFAVPNGRTTQLFINLRDNSATHDAAPFVPFGKIVAGMDVADALNSEYGESAGGGIRGGQQDSLFTGGNDYLKRNFPRLDYLKRATIVPSSAILFGGIPIRLRLSRAGDKTVRIGLEPADGGRQSDSPFLAKFSSRQVLELSELGEVKEVHVGKLRVELQPHPLTVSIRRADDTLVQRFVFPEDAGTNGINFRTASPVFGLGEGGDQFDRRGYNFPLINGQRYKLGLLGARCFSPFLVGADGWALFLASPAGSFDLRGGRGTFHPAMEGGVDLWVSDAREPADAVREFVRFTGAPALPPKWALGYLQSHRTLSTEADVLAEARKFRDDRLPCDGFIFLGTGFCPAGWNFGHDSFDWNTNVFTRDAAAVIHDLHTNHLHVVLHVVPPEKKYAALHGHIPPAPGEIVDEQDIASYWARHRDLMGAGVDGWWPDEGDWLDAASRLARQRMYYEGPLADRPDARPWDLQRNGAPGMTKYGGWIWSGDVLSSWKTLAAQVSVGLNTSLSLTPFWGTDIGGFYPGTNGDFTGELYVRWFQFAAFTPLFRSHGRNWWLHRPWGWNTGEVGPIESRPVPDPSELHDASVEPICKKYLELRYRLLPYTYTITREARDTGMPLMRMLWLEYPGDPEATRLGDEYLWGRDILVAPVTEKAAVVRRVYLPAGAWFDWWTGRKREGGRWVTQPVDLATMPLFARAGAIIPLDPVRQYVAAPVTGPTTLRIFPGADGDFTLYDDDGESQGYLSGKDRRTVWIRFRWKDAERRLVLEPDPRMKRWPGGACSFAVEIVGAGRGPANVQFRGQRMEVQL